MLGQKFVPLLSVRETHKYDIVMDTEIYGGLLMAKEATIGCHR
jgi:hypothetical protein